MARSRFLPDNFTIALIAVVALASVLPAAGRAARGFEYATTAAVALLFFLHGAKLSRQAIVAGLSHWRLHLLVIASTFVLFPLIGWALRPVLEPLVTPELYQGVIFLCVLPATVQSAIAFTAMARGNMPAAICSASGSTLLGIVITPMLVGLLLPGVPGAQAGAATAGSAGHDTLASIGRITLQLFVPFLAGHLLRPWIGGFVQRRAAVLKFVDQGSILLVVYTAFSAAVIEGLWHDIPPCTRWRGWYSCAPSSSRSRWPPPPGSAGASGSRKRTRSPWCSAAPRRASRAACPWPRCCSPRTPWARWCCR